MSEVQAEAVRFALRLLSYRPRSEREMRQRMELKGYSTDVIETAIARMKALGYINDEALAESLSRMASEGRKLGRAGARRFLRQRGISAESSDLALEGYDEQTPAQVYVEKRLGAMAKLPQDVARRRLAARLARRGFASDTIRKTITNSFKEIADETKDS